MDTLEDSTPIDYAYLRLWKIVRDWDGEQPITAVNDLQRWADAERHAHALVEKCRAMHAFIHETGLADVFETWCRVHLI